MSNPAFQRREIDKKVALCSRVSMNAGHWSVKNVQNANLLVQISKKARQRMGTRMTRMQADADKTDF